MCFHFLLLRFFTPSDPCMSCSCTPLSHSGPFLADPFSPPKHPQAPRGRVGTGPQGTACLSLLGSEPLAPLLPREEDKVLSGPALSDLV